MAIDVPGTGSGRGAGRVVFRELKDGTIDVLGVVKGHDYKKILK